MARPVYRWRSFWLGVPGLVFLLWAWWDSGMNMSAASWSRGRHDGLVIVSGGVMMLQDTEHEERELRPGSFDAHRDVILDGSGKAMLRRFSFPEEASSWSDDAESYDSLGVRIRSLLLAMWAVVSGYVGVWLGAVAAWQWRVVRVMREEEVC